MEMLAGMLIFMILIVIGVILLFVFFLLNLQNLLKEVSPSNRLVPPANVWLMFIPLFNYIYPFILYPKISESVKREFQDRGLGSKGDFSKGLGITMAVLGIVALFNNLKISNALIILGSLAAFANLVLFIIYWVKTAEYKKTLKMSPKGEAVVGYSSDLLDN